MSANQLTWPIRSENPGVYAAELRPRAKPGYVHSLSCDPVKFSQDLGRANLTLASTQNRRLLASSPTSELARRRFSLNVMKVGYKDFVSPKAQINAKADSNVN